MQLPWTPILKTYPMFFKPWFRIRLRSNSCSNLQNWRHQQIVGLQNKQAILVSNNHRRRHPNQVRVLLHSCQNSLLKLVSSVSRSAAPLWTTTHRDNCRLTRLIWLDLVRMNTHLRVGAVIRQTLSDSSSLHRITSTTILTRIIIIWVLAWNSSKNRI